MDLLAVGVPFWPGVGRLDPWPLVWAVLTPLLARWAGLPWTPASLAALVVLGTLAGLAVRPWGVAPVGALSLGLLVGTASLRRRLPRR
ncbi:MAG TPA: hypothetical protein VNO79_11115 [Actinomycetota bacterium]|nr:hypothetical protein [Actinomycetota bacterium]